MELLTISEHREHYQATKVGAKSCYNINVNVTMLQPTRIKMGITIKVPME